MERREPWIQARGLGITTTAGRLASSAYSLANSIADGPLIPVLKYMNRILPFLHRRRILRFQRRPEAWIPYPLPRPIGGCSPTSEAYDFDCIPEHPFNLFSCGISEFWKPSAQRRAAVLEQLVWNAKGSIAVPIATDVHRIT